LKAAVDAGDIADLTGIVEGEGDSADFDDFVAAVIKPGGFGIEDDALPGESRPCMLDDRSTGKPSQYAIVAGRFRKLATYRLHVTRRSPFSGQPISWQMHECRRLYAFRPSIVHARYMGTISALPGGNRRQSAAFGAPGMI